MRTSYKHNSSRRSCQPKAAPSESPWVGDEAKDGTECEQMLMASSAVKLQCRHSGLNDGYEVTEGSRCGYAILCYGSGSHLLLTGVGVEGLTDF